MKISQDTQTVHDCRTTAQSFWISRFNPRETVITVSSNEYFQGRGGWRMDSPARGGRVQENTKMNVTYEETLYFVLEIFSDIEPNTRKLSK